ncbi:unnamed protein product [Adineta steineri]|uniref:Uncharacterized protein n=1 Tax=Adineta steineri TaxID=433720 RepID=A0A818K9U3_9BILA|nr:unnamed protein product [Adineta steineri]CAF3554002.1 unnamed protein product [Adineta steineri]CAF3573745.1 unnamed protein product [Adineta steineri]
MAMVLQTNRVVSSNSSTIPMDSYNQLHETTSLEDTFHKKILDKIEETKLTRDPEKCQQTLDDFLKLLKYLTTDVTNYNLAFRETRPSFYMQEFQRLTDRIETLTKARDTLTEFLHELQDQNIETTVPYSSSFNDVSSENTQFQQQLQYSPVISHSNRSSPSEKPHHQHTPSTSSSTHSGTKDNYVNEYSTTTTTTNDHHTAQRPRSPTMTPSNFIRVHFPNKHTTALAPRNDETLAAALESRASRHSVTNIRAYTPIYMISRQPCPWDITLDRLRETEIELAEKPKLDHSFENVSTPRFVLMGVRCVVCQRRIRESHKRCVSCGNSYHNNCCTKAPVCSHPILQHIKHLGPDRFNMDRTNVQSRSKEQSRSLPRIPLPRPSINTNQGVDPRKDISHDSQSLSPPPSIPIPTRNVGSFPNAIQSTMNISLSPSSNSLYQPLSTVISSSLPSAVSPIHHIPQLLLTTNGTTIISPESLRPSMIKPHNDDISETKKSSPKYVSEWKIRAEDLLDHGRMVGKGTYGTVYKAQVRLHGCVALKELNFVSPTPTQFQAFRNEVFALKKITHQNTLNFYGYIVSPRFAIVTQWCDGSTLYKHIHILDRHWKINQLIDIARQTCQGMSYLHDREIIHRDLKSSNVFLDMCAEPDDVAVCWRVKIGDFGLAAVKTVVAEGVNQQFQPTGSVLWMAPEVIQQKDPNCYSTSSDVYAYGCVLFEMFSGKLPHAPINNKEQIMWLVGKGRLKIKVDECRDDTPEAIIDLIRQCTDYNRELRPDFAPEIDDVLSKFEFIFPRVQRSQSEPCLIRSHQDDLLGLSINYGVPKTPVSIHRRFNAEVS